MKGTNYHGEENYIKVLRNYPHQDSTKYTNFPMQSSGGMQQEDRKMITVKIDEEIQFHIDITDPDSCMTCGWLISEVTRRYNLALEALQKEQSKQRQLLGSELRMPRPKRKYIVALKTSD